MRGIFSSDDFLSHVKEKVRAELPRTEFLRTAAVDNSTFLNLYEDRVVSPRDQVSLFCLITASWYADIDETKSWYIRESIRQIIEPNEDLMWMTILINSKVDFELWLLDNLRYHTREWFGNILNTQNLLRIKRCSRIPRRNTRVRKGLRKRGYDDKGSLKPSDRWLPTSDFTFNELHELIEQKRLDNANSLQICIEVLQSG